MSKPECLSGCQWFRYGVPYCTCPHEPPDCEREYTAIQRLSGVPLYEKPDFYKVFQNVYMEDKE